MKHFVFAAMLLIPAVSVRADIVTTDFTLTNPSDSANRLTLSLLDGLTTTDLTGTFQATLDIDLVTGVVTSMRFETGSIASSNWSMNVAGIGVIAGENTMATVGSTGLAPPVNGEQFDATSHLLILNAGIVTAAGMTVQDFSTENLTIPGTGMGTLTSTLNNGFWEISITLGINSDQTVAGQNLNILGDLVGTGQVAVPEPTGVALIACLAATIGYRRRRD